jgi:hypothetical protein
MIEIGTENDIYQFSRTANADFSFRAYGCCWTWDKSDGCYDKLTFAGRNSPR